MVKGVVSNPLFQIFLDPALLIELLANEQVAIFSFIQRSTQYLKEVYPTCNEEVLDDMIELFENVL